MKHHDNLWGKMMENKKSKIKNARMRKGRISEVIEKDRKKAED